MSLLFCDLTEFLDKNFPEFEIPGGVICNERNNAFSYRQGSVVCPKSCNSYDPIISKCSCDINDPRWDDITRLVHFHEIYSKLRKAEGDEAATSLNRECNAILRKYVRRKQNRQPKQSAIEGLSFYTFTPKARIGISEGEVDKMRIFCEKFFSKKYFVKCWWVLESGKHESKPNLHIHLLGKFRSFKNSKGSEESMSKNFRRNMITAWSKIYDPKFTLKYKIPKNGEAGYFNEGIDHKPCNTLEIQNDKREYMINSKKGSHENFIDLKVNGGF